ncbi:alpha-ketoglutarate-dependent sulfate ester dioxygenase-like isoform X2 [Penaeus chinensis]|nr:alpha-ketoglutarate-dependent sulfate ester dioxygenase-like isoform X2 [Penaeus chinensis]XP_047487472.1 alpha-ketoglutarate-dependent sulfate ester dioxygenase-like isoform X2 [Penaeus chinensis]XP_047487473.1 alpha-ketoglutarate-dependent sulfate ester dioxygenase-like isoform X2 [Penaeus chinensis]XP_047487474.1 alpha-ketoglutarate-dependent sulfate ester dioxygenase-like isoform X2 [Penaeus chinensis]
MVKVLQNLCVLQVLLPKLRLITQRPQAFFLLRLIHMGTQESSHNFYKLTPVKLGCEVRGINLKQDVPPEVMAAIKEDVTKHRLLIFKDQGVVSGERHVEIAKWFNEPESTFYKHPRSPHPDVFRVSNDRSEGCTNVGRTGWHIDGSFQEAPFAYALYHMVSVPSNGPTVFAPLTDIIEELPREQRIRWERLYMISDGRSGPVHPLIYSHPITKRKVLCFHLGMTDSFIWDYKTPQQRITKEEETYSLLQEIHHEFIKNNKVRQFSHQWEVGDFIISDNLSVGHEAAPETQLPRSQVGLRILHRVTTKGHCPPAKEYDYRKELGL